MTTIDPAILIDGVLEIFSNFEVLSLVFGSAILGGASLFVKKMIRAVR